MRRHEETWTCDGCGLEHVAIPDLVPPPAWYVLTTMRDPVNPRHLCSSGCVAKFAGAMEGDRFPLHADIAPEDGDNHE